MFSCFFLYTVLQLSLSSTEWENEFDYNTFLDSSNQFKLYWSELANDTVEFGMEANATGWIALGISPTGQMPNSDVMFGWVLDNGTIYLQDRYTESQRSYPKYDTNQSLTLINGEEVDGITRIRFTRAKYTCDPQDLSINQGTTRIIAAWNKNTDPTEEFFDSNSIEWHGDNHASQSLNLDSGIPSPVQLEPDTEYFDVTNENVAVPSDDTTYWCTLIKLPEFNETHHITKIAPIVTSGNENIIHHIVTYICPSYLAESPLNTDTNAPCDDWDYNMPADQCQGGYITYAWAVGGNALYFPNVTGMPIGGDSNLHYVVLQTHYNNQDMKSGMVDSSGIRIWHTAMLRQYDAGLISIGTQVNPYGQIIPPGINYAKNNGFCTSDCTKAGMPDGSVNAFASFLHAHTIAVSLNLRQIRDDVELEAMDTNWAYDFNYQQTIIFDKTKEIKPGDEFIMECYLNSSTRDYITYGGESTQEEMCLAFIYVYPAPHLATCWTSFTPDSMGDWLNDAQDAGYLKGNVSKAINNMHYFDKLSWNKNQEGAADFYKTTLWNSSLYENRYQFCLDENGSFVTEPTSINDVIRTIPKGFKVYDNDKFNCNEDNVITTAAPNDGGKHGMRTWVIIVIVVGAIVLVAIILFSIAKCRVSKKGYGKDQELLTSDYTLSN